MSTTITSPPIPEGNGGSLQNSENSGKLWLFPGSGIGNAEATRGKLVNADLFLKLWLKLLI